MGTLPELARALGHLKTSDSRMPTLFIGHGAPTNAVEDNEYTRAWRTVAGQLPRPAAILVISAHWVTRGTLVTGHQNPPTIHDHGPFGGKTDTLNYPAPGAPAYAKMTREMVHSTTVEDDDKWGLDHGTWSVLAQMFPKADIPVYQLSLDYSRSPQFHYNLAKELSALRKKGVLIIGSGNIVHNLRMVDWRNPANVYDWAAEFDATVAEHIDSHNHQPLVDYDKLGAAARLSIPTNEHYLPLLYTLALQEKGEAHTFFADKCSMGSLSMRSLLIG